MENANTAMKKFPASGNRGFFYLGFCLLFFLICNFASAQVIINEIMYNPDQCDDSYCEWIEIYNNETTIDLTNWTLCGKTLLTGYVNKTDNKTYSNISLILNSSSYAIITDGGTGTLVYDNFNASNLSLALHVDVSSLCSGSLSANKTLILNQSNGTFADLALINSSIGGDNDNNSLQFVNNSWCAGISTPGFANNCDQQNQTNTTNSSFILSIIAFYPSNIYNNKTNFTLSLVFINFSTGFYDLKIDIKNESSLLNRFWLDNTKEWSNKNRWVENYTSINSSFFILNAISIIDSDDNFSGNASLKIQLRNSSSSYSSEDYNLTILNGIFPENNNENQPVASSSEKMTYTIEYPNTINVGENFTIQINAKNNQNHSQIIYAWSYVYKNNKCLSCDENNDRESNKIEIEIDAKEEEEIFLQNLVNEAENGTYNLKIKILKEELKTPKEYTLNITASNFFAIPIEKETEALILPQAVSNNSLNSSVYETKSERDKKLAFYLLSFTLLMIIIMQNRKDLNKL